MEAPVKGESETRRAETKRTEEQKQKKEKIALQNGYIYCTDQASSNPSPAARCIYEEQKLCSYIGISPPCPSMAWLCLGLPGLVGGCGSGRMRAWMSDMRARASAASNAPAQIVHPPRTIVFAGKGRRRSRRWSVHDAPGGFFPGAYMYLHRHRRHRHLHHQHQHPRCERIANRLRANSDLPASSEQLANSICSSPTTAIGRARLGRVGPAGGCCVCFVAAVVMACACAGAGGCGCSTENNWQQSPVSTCWRSYWLIAEANRAPARSLGGPRRRAEKAPCCAANSARAGCCLTAFSFLCCCCNLTPIYASFFCAAAQPC